MPDKKTYCIKAKVVVSQKENDCEKSGTTNEIVLEEVIVTDVKIKLANPSMRDICNSVCNGTKKCYEVTKDKLSELTVSAKEKIDNAKANSDDYQEYANAESINEKTKVVFSHIKRDGKKAGQSLKQKYMSLRQSVVEMRNKTKTQDVFVSEEHFDLEKEQTLTKSM